MAPDPADCAVLELLLAAGAPASEHAHVEAGGSRNDRNVRLEEGHVDRGHVGSGHVGSGHVTNGHAGAIKSETGDTKWEVLHLIAAAPQRVPLRRLVSLCVILRRAGHRDVNGAAAAAALANGRVVVQAALQSPPPAPLVLLCAQRPMEAVLPQVCG